MAMMEAVEVGRKLLDLVYLHWPDWLLMVILLPVNIVVDLYLPTYQRFVTKTQVTDYLYYPVETQALATEYLIVSAF